MPITPAYITNRWLHRGDMSTVSRFLLPPLLENFQTRIAARGPIEMDWKLIGTPSASVVSHRSSVFGEEQPNTAYRQAVVRIQSTQKLTITLDKGSEGWTPNASKSSSPKGFKWVPVDVRQQLKNEKKSGKAVEDVDVQIKDKPKKMTEFLDNGKTKKVTEYLVLQRRVINGREDPDWKAWGFAQESTPEKVAEDQAYWAKTLNAQVADATA
jgi:protein MBA1